MKRWMKKCSKQRRHNARSPRRPMRGPSPLSAFLTASLLRGLDLVARHEPHYEKRCNQFKKIFDDAEKANGCTLEEFIERRKIVSGAVDVGAAKYFKALRALKD